MGRKSTASKTAKWYASAFIGIVALAGGGFFFYPERSEITESQEQPEHENADGADQSRRGAPDNRAAWERPLDQNVATPGGGKEWSSSSRKVLEYLRENAEENRYDEEHFTKLLLRILPSLPPDERVRLMQETGRWFAIYAGGHAHGFLNSLLTVQDRNHFASGVMREMLASDPYRASEWAASVSDDYIAGILHNQIARTWARNDLTAALQWAQELPAGGHKADAIEGIVFTWAQQDLDAAFDWVTEMEQSEVQDRAWAKMVKVLSAKNPESAAKWAAKLPPSIQATESLGYAVQEWARRDVNASVLWLQSLEDPKILETVLQAVPMGWSNSEPAAAADWVMAWEGIEEQDQVLRRVVAKWGNSDPVEAIAWLEKFLGKDSALRDSMVEDLFEKVANKEPSRATSLVGELNSEELKTIARKAINTTFAAGETP